VQIHKIFIANMKVLSMSPLWSVLFPLSFLHICSSKWVREPFLWHSNTVKLMESTNLVWYTYPESRSSEGQSIFFPACAEVIVQPELEPSRGGRKCCETS